MLLDADVDLCMHVCLSVCLPVCMYVFVCCSAYRFTKLMSAAISISCVERDTSIYVYQRICAHAHMLPAIHTYKPQQNAVRIRSLHWVGDLYLLWVLYSNMEHTRNSRRKPCFPTCGASYTMLHCNTTHDETKHMFPMREAQFV